MHQDCYMYVALTSDNHWRAEDHSIHATKAVVRQSFEALLESLLQLQNG